MNDKACHMADDKFVEYCYNTILLREPDRQGKSNYLALLKSGKSREEILISFLESEEYKRRSLSREFVNPGHYFSAVPSHEDRSRFLKTPEYNFSVLGIDLNEERQLSLLNEFEKVYKEVPFPHKKSDGFRYYFDNPAYSYGDGIILYCMIRHFKPKRIIEIGSGFSSCLMLDTSDMFFDGKIQVILVEPYPERILYSLLNENEKTNVILKPEKLQEADQSIFSELEKNDILFIDSSHVSKLCSDVNKIFFDILPSLNEGVLIHIHDIFWPFEYSLDWIQEGRSWNEAYLLRAFLQYNLNFKILFFSTYLLWKHPQWFKKNMPMFLENPGGNIWIEKVAK
jgi:predicted O-methyltransferase YrrM